MVRPVPDLYTGRHLIIQMLSAYGHPTEQQTPDLVPLILTTPGDTLYLISIELKWDSSI